MRILVTGVYGFIGSNFARMAIELDHQVVGFSRLSNNKNKDRINSIVENPNFTMINGDLSNPNDVSELCEGIDVVVNFAAKTFVDHSIRDPKPFIDSNIVGTFNLLESARRYQPKLYIQISTDEVYGSIMEGMHDELSALNPGNPYSASKSAGDMLCLSYFNTYKLPIIITRTENNYGPYQHPQKAIPVWTRKAINNEPIPLYGDGAHIRQWLHVQDHCYAILHLIEKGKPGEIYHVAGNEEYKNIDIVNKILQITNSKSEIEFIPDDKIRPGHDRRYAISSEKLRILGWSVKNPVDLGLKQTVEWFRLNAWWWFR